MLASQETCPHCGQISPSGSPYAAHGTGPTFSRPARNATNLYWALPLGALSLFLIYFGGKCTYFAVLKGGLLGTATNKLIGISAYDSLAYYFQIPIGLIVLLLGGSLLATSWKSVAE
jgi:hypothetical protein